MTKNERITELEVEVDDLRHLIAKLVAKVKCLELSDNKQDAKPRIPWTQPCIVPQWSPGLSLTCKATESVTPANAWPFPVVNK